MGVLAGTFDIRARGSRQNSKPWVLVGIPKTAPEHLTQMKRYDTLYTLQETRRFRGEDSATA